jgi:Sulfotransferase family
MLARRFYPKMKSISGHNLLDVMQFKFENPFYITFMRDPIERTLSGYQDHILSTKQFVDFETWFNHEAHHNVQVKKIAGEENLEKALANLNKFNFVGLTEHFDQSLHILKSLLPEDWDFRYFRRRTHQSNKIKEATRANEKFMRMIKEKNALDRELYRFAKNTLFADYLAKSRLDLSENQRTFNLCKTDFSLKYKCSHFYNNLFRQYIKRNPV